MELSLGKVAFPIKFDNGAEETIYFNPSDPNLITRLADFQIKLESKAKEMDDKENSLDGFFDFQKFVCDEIDRVFEGEVSAKVFKYRAPFAIVNGDYFITQFLDRITPEIQKKVEESNEAVAAKIAKHINKYKK